MRNEMLPGDGYLMLNLNDFIKLIENTDNKEQIKLIVDCLDACELSSPFMAESDWVKLTNSIIERIRRDDMK